MTSYADKLSPYTCAHGLFAVIAIAKNVACQVPVRAVHCLASDSPAKHSVRQRAPPMFLEKHPFSLPRHEQVPECRVRSYMATTVEMVTDRLTDINLRLFLMSDPSTFKLLISQSKHEWIATMVLGMKKAA